MEYERSSAPAAMTLAERIAAIEARGSLAEATEQMTDALAQVAEVAFVGTQLVGEIAADDGGGGEDFGTISIEAPSIFGEDGEE